MGGSEIRGFFAALKNDKRKGALKNDKGKVLRSKNEEREIAVKNESREHSGFVLHGFDDDGVGRAACGHHGEQGRGRLGADDRDVSGLGVGCE